MERKAFDVKNHDFKEWNEVFNNSQPIKIKNIVTGHLILNKRCALNPDNPKARVIEYDLL